MMTLESDAFEDDGRIPLAYSCEGDGINPPLYIEGTPPGSQSLVLTMYDPDVPVQLKSDGTFDHWVVYNIAPDVDKIPEGGPVPGTEGINSTGKAGYTPPCPPKEYEPSEHRYVFTVFALDTELGVSAKAGRAEVESALEGHVLGQAQLTGRYRKQGK